MVDWKARGEAVIPGGMYGHQSVKLLPDSYPQYFSRAAGASVWDADGKEYLDFMCGYGPNLFGYGHDGIDDAYVRQMKIGDTMTGPSTVMIELAEAMTAMVTHAAWAMFCKNGTDATTMALMIARQHTGKSTVLMATGAYHGAAPWCTPIPNGVTAGDRSCQINYVYNDIESLRAAVAQAGDDLAAVFVSPFKHDVLVDQQLVRPDFAQEARRICTEAGALLIVDDVRAGFRVARDSSWATVGIEPDLSTWGKAIANGHAISALLGSEAFREAASAIYATGSFWFSAAPMAAALETMRLIRETDYLEETIRLGDRLRVGLAECSARHGFGLRQTGPSQLPLMLFEGDAELKIGYAWCDAMMQRGIYLHPWHNMFMCTAMTDADIDRTVETADGVFREMVVPG